MNAKYVILAVALAAGVAFSQEPTRSVWDGVYTADQAKRGETAYNTNCASCHGDQLNGGEMAPPLAGGEFMSNWNGLTVGDLYDRIRTTMPAGKPGSLSRETNVDIVSFILAFNKFPAGDQELPHSSEALKQIKLEAEKPAKK
ncbi:MAG TPA: cytochrome c [Bryobacteraceae bacterium]|nr:cytochrome c [Bryobacteraceae bacterium]